MKKIGWTFIVLIATGSQLWAGSQTGADFLKIPVGARGMGLAQSYTALANGTDAMNWNVAGIIPSRTESYSPMNFTLSHEELFFQNSLDYFALSKPYQSVSMGFSLLRMSYPTQDQRDTNRNVTGSVGASDMALGFAFATSWKGIRFGSQGKLIRQELGSESATGAAVDLGVLTPLPISRLQIGAAVHNLGSAMTFIKESAPLPLSVSIGAAYQFSNPFVLTMDLSSLVHQHQTTLSFGTEFYTGSSVVLRAGYLAKLATTITNNQLQETNRGTLGGLSGMNAGFGFKISNFTLDYAISPFGELGNVHTFTLSTAFGSPAQMKKPVSSDATTTPDNESNTDDRKIIIFDQSHDSAPWWRGDR